MSSVRRNVDVEKDLGNGCFEANAAELVAANVVTKRLG